MIKMKNKKIMLGILAMLIILSTTVSAIIMLENGFLLEITEMASVTDQQIQNYMTNNLVLADYKLMENKIITYYNITYLEPTNYYNPENNPTEKRYRVFTQYKPFIIKKGLWNYCLNKTTPNNCINILVNNPEPFVWQTIEVNTLWDDCLQATTLTNCENLLLNNPVFAEQVNQGDTIINKTIKSTYLQAYEEQERQYYRAKLIRDNAIQNNLEELFNTI